jgi:hypothetical protein
MSLSSTVSYLTLHCKVYHCSRWQKRVTITGSEGKTKTRATKLLQTHFIGKITLVGGAYPVACRLTRLKKKSWIFLKSKTGIIVLPLELKDRGILPNKDKVDTPFISLPGVIPPTFAPHQPS